MINPIDSKHVTRRTIVERVCDDCGKRELKTYGQLLQSHSRRHSKKDLCRVCAYKVRIIVQKEGKDSVFWRGGISMNPTSGYLRVNKTTEYLHKKIFGDSLGRKLTRTERVHHIDMNKLNNELSNLWLCENESEHQRIHAKMEMIGFAMYGSCIWFDWDSKNYTTQYVPIKKLEDLQKTVTELPSCASVDNNGKVYSAIYLGNKKHEPFHRFVVKKYLRSNIKSSDHVHHVDGNTTNNRLDNLCVLTRSEHKICHNSLQTCVAKLFKMGIVIFKEGDYLAL